MGRPAKPGGLAFPRAGADFAARTLFAVVLTNILTAG
jgi:hypothetical protein